jgi:hypothetical protein
MDVDMLGVNLQAVAAFLRRRQRVVQAGSDLRVRSLFEQVRRGL